LQKGAAVPIAEQKRGIAAFKTYLSRLQKLMEAYEAPRILELGGGRKPSFTLADLPSNVSSYTVNDISAEELALTAPEYEKAQFDVIGDVSEFAGQFDVVFSRTLAEHVRDGQAMHQNVLKLLKPNGVAFHLAPTLYAPPFVINKILPETLSRKALLSFFPNRRTEYPKFPAYYSWCFGNRKKMERMLRRLGYRDVEVTTFYGHSYFEKIPVVRELDRAFSALAARKDWSTFGSFVHIVGRK
jgi:SAM-dependent methyltransferase